MKRSIQRGFTVIELVVVIVVISILVTIIVVMYSRVQVDARDTKRANDMRVMTAALDKYFEKNGMYPSGCGGTTCTGFAGLIIIPNTDIISTQTTQTQLAAMLGDNVSRVADPRLGSSTQTFIGPNDTVSNAPGYVYRGAQTLDPSAESALGLGIVVLQEASSGRSCTIKADFYANEGKPNDTMTYVLAYYAEGTKTWQVKFGDKGKKPYIDSSSTAGFCNVVP